MIIEGEQDVHLCLLGLVQIKQRLVLHAGTIIIADQQVFHFSRFDDFVEGGLRSGVAFGFGF